MDDDHLEAGTLVLLFTAYYFLERILRGLVARYNSSFLSTLTDARKDPVFFGIFMGLIISLVSAPYCSRAAWSAWASPLPGTWALDSDAKICLSARAVLWVSELNRLDLYPLYVVHHAGALASLLSTVYFQWPVATYFVLLSTLVSEVPGDAVWMLSAYIDSTGNASPTLARLKLRLKMFNVAQYTLLRGTGIILATWLLLCKPEFSIGHSPVWVQVIAATLLVLYATFCAVYVVRQSCSIHAYWHPKPDSPSSHHHIRRATHIRIPTNPAIIILPYGVYMGMGFAALVLTSFTLAVQSPTEIGALKVALRITLLSAIVGSRLFSLIMEDGLARLLSHPVQTIFRPGFWLHGGIFGAALGAAVASQLGYVPSLPLFVASLAVGLPLYEMFSRLGCHTYGCCYGRPATSAPRPLLWRLFPFPAAIYDHPADYAATRLEPKLLGQPLVPIQLISAALFLLLFACVSLPLAVSRTPHLAGAATLGCHAAVRLATETCRADFRGAPGRAVSSTGKMALVQAAAAAVWLAYVCCAGSPPARLDFRDILSGERMETCALAAAIGILAYGVHIDQIGTWIPQKTGVKDSEKSES